MSPTILVVDDDQVLRQVLVSALRDAGYGVDQAGDGVMAMRRIAMRAPDAILCDVRMPLLDGIGLATVLGPHTPSIPIILMSADPRPTGCTLPHLRKPFSLDDALTLMARTLPTSLASVALARLGAV